MAWTTPATWADSTVYDAADFDQQIKDNLGFLYNPPSCLTANNANQNLTHQTNTAINMQTELWDTDTIHSTAANTYRHDINTAGTYLQYAGGQFAYAAGGYRSIFLQENGTTRTGEALVPGPTSVPGVESLQCGHTGLMTTSDYIDLYGYQNSGGTVAVQSGTVFMLSHWCGNP